MRKRSTEEQINGVLREAEFGIPVAELYGSSKRKPAVGSLKARRSRLGR